MSVKKLDMQHRHIIRLIDRNKNGDGFASVSDQLFPVLSKNMPTELVEFSGSPGCYKARLTEEGINVLKAMLWIV